MPLSWAGFIWGRKKEEKHGIGGKGGANHCLPSYPSGGFYVL
jgi:hypothetical protein